MAERNPEDKQRRLLEAALTEFAATGLRGTRVEAIAARAGCSSGLIYTYFGSKEALFDAVLDAITARVTTDTPMTGDDLPGYAARLFDDTMNHPDVVRFAIWHQLERGGARAAATDDAVAAKIAAVQAAQDEELVPPGLDPAIIVLAVQAIARMWVTEPEPVIAAVDPAARADYRRRAVQDVVSALLRPR